MQNSRIEWTDHTWNPWIGCQKVSPGCQYCYAETYGNRFGVQWGPQGERKRTSPANWRKPLAWNRQRWMQCRVCGWRGVPDRNVRVLACAVCRSPSVEETRQRVFCASLADVFEDRPELIPWRVDLFDLISNTPNLDWLLLTKRPENIQRLWPWSPGVSRPNIWLGTSVENQGAADKRILELIRVPAKVRFLSCEPLLEQIDLGRFLWLSGASTAGPWYDATGRLRHGGGTGGQMLSSVPSGDIDWVICGGESGPHARPMHPDWVRSLRDQCAEAGVPFFFKQWGNNLPNGQMTADGIESHLKAATIEAFGGMPPERSIQWDDAHWAYRMGKKEAAGRYLDGRIHRAFPL